MALTRIWFVHDDGTMITLKKNVCIPMNEEPNERR